MKLMLTAFDPFGGEKINPALEAVKLVDENITNLDLIKVEIPTSFEKSTQVIRKKIQEESPDFIICVGQAGGRSEITVERVAINIDDARIEDNDGFKPIDEKIFKDGSDGYFSTLPIKAMVEKIQKAGLKASVSNTAGTFVCNHLMYTVLYLIGKNHINAKAGFIHVPYIPEQVKGKKSMPSMPLQEIVKGLEAAILALEENPTTDLKISGGREF